MNDKHERIDPAADSPNPDVSSPGDARPDHAGPARRLVMKAGLVGAAAAGLAATGVATGNAATGRPGPTPGSGAAKPGKLACTPGSVTDANIEGPYFEPGSPQRTDITPGVNGVLLTLTGTVYNRRCQPLAGALLDFWQCDSSGYYDNEGYTLRGHQYTSGTGAYALSTIIPSDYEDEYSHRTPHIHVKVQARGGPILTTQLFFPDDTQAYGLDFAWLNAQDQLIDPNCSITSRRRGDGNYDASFDFVVRTY
ncbi:dioxygenase [Actinomadura gamaensis]|uniref:Dioxygenase n=1 Tax=Actinomadura gamaensis TaxID=1763541 RepID=A0ABV9U1J4_9ACTN